MLGTAFGKGQSIICTSIGSSNGQIAQWQGLFVAGSAGCGSGGVAHRGDISQDTIRVAARPALLAVLAPAGARNRFVRQCRRALHAAPAVYAALVRGAYPATYLGAELMSAIRLNLNRGPQQLRLYQRQLGLRLNIFAQCRPYCGCFRIITRRKDDTHSSQRARDRQLDRAFG